MPNHTDPRAGQPLVMLLDAVRIAVLGFALLGCAPRAEGIQPAWVQRQVPGPSIRGEHAFVFDPVRSVGVLFGGADDLCFCQVNDETWTWNGTSWMQLAISGPSMRCDNAMAFDTAREITVSFGGFTQSVHSDTWLFDGAAWSIPGPPPPPPLPPGRADAGMAFDAARGQMVMLGGLGAGGVLSDMWTWNGSQWTRSTAPLPPRRWIHRMVYDEARQRIVTFGGAAPPNVVLGDTWEWDGASWAQRAPAVSPAARYGYALAYDSHRQVTVLFGGQTASNFGQGVLADTWEWDGTNWREISVTGPLPPARSFCKMVYDSTRRRMVLFGGYDGTQFLGDTWELAACPADFDRDGFITGLDFDSFVLAFEAGNPSADFDGDGFNTGLDFDGYVNAFEAGC